MKLSFDKVKYKYDPRLTLTYLMARSDFLFYAFVLDKGKNPETMGVCMISKVIDAESTHMSRVMRKPTFCICENKDADQLRGNREADQRLCFRYTDSTIPLLPKSEISSL